MDIIPTSQRRWEDWVRKSRWSTWHWACMPESTTNIRCYSDSRETNDIYVLLGYFKLVPSSWSQSTACLCPPLFHSLFQLFQQVALFFKTCFEQRADAVLFISLIHLPFFFAFGVSALYSGISQYICPFFSQVPLICLHTEISWVWFVNFEIKQTS